MGQRYCPVCGVALRADEDIDGPAALQRGVKQHRCNPRRLRPPEEFRRFGNRRAKLYGERLDDGFRMIADGDGDE